MNGRFTPRLILIAAVAWLCLSAQVGSVMPLVGAVVAAIVVACAAGIAMPSPLVALTNSRLVTLITRDLPILAARHRIITFAILAVATAAMMHDPWTRGRPLLGVLPWHDSESYLLGARLLLEGRLARPALPHPEFFRTLHVLVEPIYCSKYPPGYSALLAAAMWLHAAEWLPPLLVGLTVGAAWRMALRLIGPAAAFWSALAVIGSPVALFLGTIQLSSTASLLIGTLVVGVYAIGRRRDCGLLNGLLIGVLLSALLLTRPFDALVLGVSIGVIEIASGMSAGRLRGRWIGGAWIGAVVGAVLMVSYHRQTTGQWLTAPYVWYEATQSYSGMFLHEPVNAAPELEQMPITVQRFAKEFTAVEQRQHTVVNLPGNALRRLRGLLSNLSPALLLLPLALWPTRRLIAATPKTDVSDTAATLRAASRVATTKALGAVAVIYFAAYLWYAYGSPHYFAPVVVALIWAAASGLRRISDRHARQLMLTVFAALAVAGVVQRVAAARSATLDGSSAAFQAALATTGDVPCIVFVRYAADHNIHRELVYNEANLDAAKVIISHDLGAEYNRRLMATWPERKTFVYDEASGMMIDAP